jgi:hypothetical protein
MVGEARYGSATAEENWLRLKSRRWRSRSSVFYDLPPGENSIKPLMMNAFSHP